MNPYTFRKVQQAYFASRQYEPVKPYESGDSLFQWPGNRYLKGLKKDIPLLQESLAPAPEVFNPFTSLLQLLPLVQRILLDLHPRVSSTARVR